jgi:hypothetical protein
MMGRVISLKEVMEHPCTSFFCRPCQHIFSAHPSNAQPPLDPYNNDHVMSLKEFVGHPLAQELLHNGQLFQVRGEGRKGLSVSWCLRAYVRACLREAAAQWRIVPGKRRG